MSISRGHIDDLSVKVFVTVLVHLSLPCPRGGAAGRRAARAPPGTRQAPRPRSEIQYLKTGNVPNNTLLTLCSSGRVPCCATAHIGVGGYRIRHF